MKSKGTFIAIIALVLVVGIGGVVAYAVAQNNNSGDSSMSSDMDMSSEKNSTSTGDSGSEADAVEATEVSIESFAYTPKVIKVKVGTKVTWTNKDGVDHTVTTEGNPPAKIDSGLFGKDETFEFTFEKAGTYQYFCEPHTYMKGTVIVTE